MAIKYEDMTESEKFSANAHVQEMLRIAAIVKADHERRGIPPLKWVEDGD